MDATQVINDSILESDEEENEEERQQPLAKLCILQNKHIPAAELPLFLGENMLGRDPSTCTLPFPANSVSKQHATICLSGYRRRGRPREVDVEALVWDLGSLNGTRKGRLKLTPNVRYALGDGDSLVVADIPCQYVSCAVNTASSQEHTRTPVSQNPGVKAGVPDTSSATGGDTSTGRERCVNGGVTPSAMVPQFDQEDTRKTPARAACLSLEQTPNQPQGTLVPESDSDSDGERGGQGDRRCKSLVLDSGKSDRTSSTFLSPTSKIVPESEDESPIAASSFTKNRPRRHASYSEEEPDVDAGRQQLRQKATLVIMDDSEEEDGTEGERATPGGTAEESGQDVLVKQENNVSLPREEDPLVSTRAVATDVIPVFKMDSDTDVEGEEESVAPVTLNANKHADQPTKTAQFHMDSDTDVDEDEDMFGEGVKSVPSSDDTKPAHAVPVIQPEDVTMDSDTDVDDDADMSNAAANVKPTSSLSSHTAENSKQPVDFHLDSDTDVDEEEENKCGTNSTCSKVDEAPAKLEIKSTGSESASLKEPVDFHLDSDTDVDEEEENKCGMISTCSKVDEAPVEIEIIPTVSESAPLKQPVDFHLDSDTDVEEEENECGTNNICSKIAEAPARIEIKPTGSESAPSKQPVDFHLDSDTDDEAVVPDAAVSEAALVSTVTDPCTATDAVADNSYSDVEVASPLVIPVAITSLSVTPGITVAAAQSDSDADTDLDESSVPSAGGGDNPADLGHDGGTDVEDKVAARGEAGEDQIPSLHREITPGLIVPLPQNCSTPMYFSEGEVEEMETQAFLSPSSGPFRRGAAPAAALSSCSDSQDDDNFVVPETQPFTPQTHNNHDMEPTQPFAFEPFGDARDGQSSRGGSFQMRLSDSSHLQCRDQALAMENTQAFISVDEAGVNMDDAADRTSAETNENMEATQAYGEQEDPASSSMTSEKKGRVDFALEPTQAYISEDEMEEDEGRNLTTAETQPLDFPASYALALSETQAAPPEIRLTAALSIAETQPMSASEDEDSVPGPRKRKVKQLFTNSESSAVETQPIHTGVAETQPMTASGNEESDDEDSIPIVRKRKAKQLFTSSESSAVETQPMQAAVAETQPMTVSGNESDEEDSIPIARKRKAKQLFPSSESSAVETQPVLSAVAETQPMAASGNEESDEEDSIPFSRKSKAKQLRLEDETQTLVNSDLSVAATQPMETCGDEGSDDEGLVTFPRKRKANQLNQLNSELSVAATQPIDTCDDEESDDEDSIPGPRKKRKAKQLQLEEEQTQPLTDSGDPSNEAAEDTEEDDDESVIGVRRKRKAKLLHLEDEATQSLTYSEASTVESQPTREAGPSGTSIRSTRGMRARLREEEKQVESSEPLRRQTRGNKTLPTTRGRRQKSSPDRSEEEETEQSKQARRTRSTRKGIDNEEEEDKLELMRKEQQQGMLGEEKDVPELGQQEREEAEKERRKIDEQVRMEMEKRQQEETERQQRIEQERIERKRKDEEERLRAEEAERLRLEQERAEKERKERERREEEEKERADRIQREKEQQLERERKEKQEKAEREERERLEKERIEKERREQEERERLETAKKAAEEQERLEREREEQERQERLKAEAKEREEREKLEKEKEAEEKQAAKAPPRGRRAARRTIADPGSAEQDSTVSANNDIPAMRTRSRSNSSNSVSSERSTSSVGTQGSRGRGRGRGRGAKRSSDAAQAAAAPTGSSRRRTLAAPPTVHRDTTEQDSMDVSSEPVISDTATCSISSQSRGRGGRQRGRGRRTEPGSIPPNSSQMDQDSASKPTARGRQSRRGEVFSNEEETEKADSQQPSTSRGRRRADLNSPEPPAEETEGKSHQEEGSSAEASLLIEGNVRGRGQKAAKGEITVTAAVSDGGKAKDKRKGREKKSEVNVEGAQTAGEAANDAAQAKRRGRASGAQGGRNVKESAPEASVEDKSEKVEEEEETAERRARGRLSNVQIKEEDVQEESGKRVDPIHQGANIKSEPPQTPTSRGSRKRPAPADSSPVVKNPRSSSSSSSSSPASARIQAARQAYKVLFTGMEDEALERVLVRLKGSMAKGVADMNCLVTDKVRRTVKFLCAVAKGVPIVTTHWLEKSGKAGSFLSPNAFIVNDPEQETKFNFSLQQSLRAASSQPLLQGYEIHVTKSVKPDPVYMKDIISCSGATFLPKMPSSHKPQTVVISCEEDLRLCGPAVSASLPVVTAEFILTGILQQKVDFQTHELSVPLASLQPAAGRGRGRKKT